MNNSTILRRVSCTLMCAMLAYSSSAQAFRCGQKLVREEMHELEVRKICGTPETTKSLGFVIRAVPIQRHRGIDGFSTTRDFGYGQISEQVALTEYVYNFGPRKLMRRLLFEGGILVRIETVGYGFVSKKPS